MLSKVETASGMVTTVKSGLSYPEDVEVDWANGEVFVSERTGAAVRVSGERPVVIAKPGGAPQQLGLVKKGSTRFLFTVCYDSGKLVRIDLATHAIKTIASGLGHSVGLVLDAATKYAYVTEQDKNALTRINPASGTKSTVIGGLIAPFFLAWDKGASGIFFGGPSYTSPQLLPAS